jgi:thioredoxin 1
LDICKIDCELPCGKYYSNITESLIYVIRVGFGEDFMNEKPVHVTDAEFEKIVLQSELPVVVDFWAPWCGPCKMVAPVLDKIAKEQAGKLVIAKVNTDEDQEWAIRFGVQGIPTMLFVAKGKIIHQQVGALPEGVLRQLMDKFLEVVNSPEPLQ